MSPNDSLRDVLAPVPLHPKRERSRGYNQSHLLAREVSRRIQVPMADDRLLRTVDTPPQVSMSGREERRKNIDGAFECTQPVTGLRVLLIDDVVTTRQHDVGMRLRAEGRRGCVSRGAGARTLAAIPATV